MSTASRDHEIIITAAIVGAELTREHTPYLPLTAEEIGIEAQRCADEGAAVIHLHVRDEQGRSTQAADYFQAAIDAIRARADVVIQVSTGGAVGMTAEERLAPLSCAPEMATLNCGSINFGDDVFVNSRPMMRTFAEKIRHARVTPELEVYEVGHIDNALALQKEDLLSDPLHFQFVLGVPGAAGAREDVLRFFLSQIPASSTWGIAAVGRHQLPMAQLAARLGGNVRVGLEDNIYVSKGVLAKGSYELVQKVVALVRGEAREPVSTTRARELLKVIKRG